MGGSFNWIFILIAGTVILIFFITIVQKQKEISQIKLAASIRTDISAILTGAGVTADTTNILTMPKTEIYFTCDEEGYSDFEIARTGVNKKTSFDVIFAPDFVKGPTLVTWAKEFKIPFKVMNFLYLTDAQVRYILVFSPGNQLAEKIEAELPDELNRETVSPGANVADKNNYKVKFVFFEGFNQLTAAPFKNMPDKDVSAIEITSNEIRFYQKKGQYFALQGAVPYLRDEDDTFIYGAIFSEDRIFYECNLKKALKRTAAVTKLFADRESEIKTLAGSGCAAYYFGKISELLSFVEPCSENINLCDFGQISSTAYSPFGIKYNHDETLAYHTECPQIY